MLDIGCFNFREVENKVQMKGVNGCFKAVAKYSSFCREFTEKSGQSIEISNRKIILT